MKSISGIFVLPMAPAPAFVVLESNVRTRNFTRKTARYYVLSLLLGLLLVVAESSAGTANCEGLYVGRIWIEKGTGLYGVVFLNNPGDVSGSYWTYFTGWTPDDWKAALATLTSAKLMQHRVHVTTEASGGCSIDSASQNVKSVYLANDP